MFLKKRWSLLLLKHRRQTAKFQFVEQTMKTFYTSEREIWREWLVEHFEIESEVWFVFPMKESSEKALPYNDAVEEALCFGWIDSTIKHIDPTHRAQRFTPRKKRKSLFPTEY